MLNVELETLDAECGVGDLKILSVYPWLFWGVFSSFPTLSECPECKLRITQLSCDFHAWIKLDILEINPITVIDFIWCITSNDVESHVNDLSKKGLFLNWES